MTLVPSVFKSLGWEWKPPYYVYKKGKSRLGWNPSDGTFIIGYGELPVPVTTAVQLANILSICEYDDEYKKLIEIITK